MSEKFTLDEQIVRDSLRAIARTREATGTKLVINGGIANQLLAAEHLPESFRPTHDVDFISPRYLGAPHFRTLVGAPISESMQSHNPEVSVNRHVYEIEVHDSEEDSFFIHTYRWTKNGFARNEEAIDRWTSNAEYVQIPGAEEMAAVARPEDLIKMKLRRLDKIEANNKLTIEQSALVRLIKQRKWEHVSEHYSSDGKQRLVKLKNRLPAMYDAGPDRFRSAMNEYSAEKDLYDVALLARLASKKAIDIDEQYMSEVLTT